MTTPLASVTAQFESVTRPARVVCSVCAQLDPWPECLPADTMRQLRIGHGPTSMSGEVGEIHEAGFIAGSLIGAPSILIVTVRSIGTPDALAQCSTLARRAWMEVARARPQGLVPFIDRVISAGVGGADADDFRWVVLLFLIAWEGRGPVYAERSEYVGTRDGIAMWRQHTGRSVGFASTLDTDVFHASALVLRWAAESAEKKSASRRDKSWLGPAMMAVCKYPHESDAQIAERVRVAASTLSRDPTYKAAAARARPVDRRDIQDRRSRGDAMGDREDNDD